MATTFPPEENPSQGLQARLRDPQAEERLRAIQQIAGQSALDLTLLPALELIAARDPEEMVRRAAQAVLEQPAGRAAQRSLAGRNAPAFALRAELVRQIYRWLFAGRITADQAAVLRGRFSFDFENPALSREAGLLLAQSVEDWARQGLIDAAQAQALRAELPALERPPAAAVAATTETGAPAAAQPPATAAPATAAPRPVESAGPAPTRQSLMEVLFSEVSIRIALYLGGFLVAAAALILAALLEVARLPILLTLTALAGGAAFGLRRRLPLPSNVLFLLFAVLLPMDARVLSDLVGLNDSAAALMWSLVWALEALVLGLGAVIYRSRLLAILAPLPLNLTAIMLTFYIGHQSEDLYPFEDTLPVLIALLSLVGLASVPWMLHIRRMGWRPLGVMILTALQMALVLGAALLYWLFGGDANIRYAWMLPLPWLVGAITFTLIDTRVERFVLFPGMAVAAATFVPFTFLSALDLRESYHLAGVALSGLLFLAAGVALVRSGQHATRQRYGPWLLAGALFLAAWVNGWAADFGSTRLLPYLTLTAAALTLAAVALQNFPRARVPLWVTALLAAVLAYFMLFEQPWMRPYDPENFQLVILVLLLLVPDLFLKPDLQAQRGWRWPARIIGVGLALLATVIALSEGFYQGVGNRPDLRDSAIIFGVLGGLALAAGLRYRRPWLGYAFSAYSLLALVFTLISRGAEHWMLPMAVLALVLYMIGYDLPRRSAGEYAAGWSRVLRTSGLLAGLAVALRFFEEASPGPGPQTAALLLAAGLFLLERHAERHAWRAVGVELAMDALLVLALASALGGEPWSEAKTAALTSSAVLIVLGADLYFRLAGRNFRLQAPWPETAAAVELPEELPEEMPAEEAGPGQGRPAARQSVGSRLESEPRWLVSLVGLVLTFIAVGTLVFMEGLAAGIAAGWLGALAGFYLLAALLYPAPPLAALVTGLAALSLLFGLRANQVDGWVGPLMLLAVAIYALSAGLDRWWLARGQSGPLRQDWLANLRLSALGLAMLVALTAPFEDRLSSSVPVAAAATLYAIEAWRQRNVWLGFPANGLYLLAYFIVLAQLEVVEPQYYSLGVAVLGMLMHYLLVRSGSRMGAFLTGMVSQLALLGTTYVQMFSTHRLSFFVILFFQGLVVLAYGIAIRSRSLVITPLIFIVLGVVTVVLSILSGVPTALLIGCTGVTLLMLGILAVLMRERLLQAGERLGEQMGGWRA